MATLSTVAVDFIANTSKFISGLEKMSKSSKAFSAGLQKDAFNAAKDLANIGKAAAVAGAAIYGGLAVGIGKSIAEISKLKDEADKIGADSGNFMALGAAAKQAGAELEDVSRAFIEIQKSINEARGGNQATIENFNQLGLSFVKISSLKPEDRFVAIADALSKVTDENKKTELGVALLGKAYNQLRPVLDNGAAGLAKLREENAALGITIDTIDIKRIKETGENFEKLGNTAQGAFNLITAGIAPVVNKLFDSLFQWLKKDDNMLHVVQNSLYALSTPIIAVLKTVDALIAAFKYGQGVMSMFISYGAKAMEKLLNPVVSLTKAWDSLAGVIVGAVNAAIVAFNNFANKNIPLVTISSNVSSVVESFQRDMKVFSEAAKDESGKYFKEASDAYDNGYAKKVEDKVAQISVNIADAYYRAKNAAIASGKDFTDALKNTFNNSGNVFSALNRDSSLLGSVDRSQLKPLGYQLKIGEGNQQAISDFEKLSQLSKVVGQDVTKMYLDIAIAQDKANQKYKEEADRVIGVGMSLRESTMTAQEVYDRRIKDIERATTMTDKYGQALLTTEQAARATRDAQVELWSSTNSWVNNVRDGMNAMADGMAQAIVNGNSLSDVFRNLAKDITAMILKQMVLNTLLSMIGLVNPAAGASFAKMMNMPGRASGGPVDSNTAYMVGEKGPEMFVPRSNGYILPNGLSSKGGDTVIINQTFQTGVAQTVRAEMMSMLPAFKANAMQGVIDARSRGGSYAKALTV
jgi:hypothetical protein